MSPYNDPAVSAAYEDDGTRYPTTVLYYPSVGTTAPHHNPTAKPLGLVEELVLTYSNPGDVVVEPFGGDVPAGVACLKNGRQYYGCENDQPQYEWSKLRLQAAAAKPTIFSLQAA
jgi:site-specific DNA-methyltransferase (adenine-specific)